MHSLTDTGNPKIGSHLRNDTWRPQKDWPNVCFVQWGRGGVVFASKTKAYHTAFFEVFPPNELNASGFIRGEGKSLEEAESSAFKKINKSMQCDHVIGRRGYTNGGGLCLKCKEFFSGSFPPIVTLGEWKEPLEISDLLNIKDGFIWRMYAHYLTEKGQKPNNSVRDVHLKAKVMGLPTAPHIDDQT